jgi:hypothetical protein
MAPTGATNGERTEALVEPNGSPWRDATTDDLWFY